MGLKRRDFDARAVKRRALSKNQVAAKERLRLERLATAESRLEREIKQADNINLPLTA